MSAHLLLVEDDIELQSFIIEYLKDYNYHTIGAKTPLEALEIIKTEQNIQLIILDLTLPQMDGFDLFKKIKAIKNIPIIISSARGDIGNKIHGFEIGADDYLTKPYEPRELVLRIEYILKKLNIDTYTLEPFVIDKKNRTILLDDYPIDLTKIEFDIFIYLIENVNKIASREQIIHAANLDPNTRNRTIDTHISNIRNKIELDPKHPIYIHSVWGIGYKFVSK